MASSDSDLDRILESLDGLRREVTRLRERVSALEGRSGTEGTAESWDALAGRGPRVAAPGAAVPPDALDPELVFTIAAAVAAYLGKEPHIRSVRLVRSSAWAQQGRATIQAWYSVSPPSTARGGEVS